jgi:hypothetical protein
MCWFKKKYLYKITWAYDSHDPLTYTEYIKASDIASAWQKIVKSHSLSVDCREIIRVDENHVGGNRICP